MPSVISCALRCKWLRQMHNANKIYNKPPDVKTNDLMISKIL